MLTCWGYSLIIIIIIYIEDPRGHDTGLSHMFLNPESLTFIPLYPDTGQIINILIIPLESLPPTSYTLSTCHRAFLLALSYAFSRSIKPTYTLHLSWGKTGFNCWGVKGTALVLFLSYVNVSRMRTQSPLSSQPLTIPAPWVLLGVKCSIPLFEWFHPGWLRPVFLRGIGRLS